MKLGNLKTILTEFIVLESTPKHILGSTLLPKKILSGRSLAQKKLAPLIAEPLAQTNPSDRPDCSSKFGNVFRSARNIESLRILLSAIQ